MKSKSFKFYYQDFLVGTDHMTLPAIGAYIKCLCHQADKGFISKTHMQKICGGDTVMNEILPKFITDTQHISQSDTHYINERLNTEIDKSIRYSESRAVNRKGKPAKKKTKPGPKPIPLPPLPVVEPKPKPAEQKKVIVMPWDADEFKTAWESWKAYKKKEYAFKFKSEESEQAALMKLANLSNGDRHTAQSIIMQSIENGWKGFFELKTNGKNGKSGIDIAQQVASNYDAVDQLFDGE